MLNALTLEDVVASKLGYVRVMGDEVLQKASELVPLPKGHVTPYKVLMHHTQMEVVAERVNVHQIPDLIALLGEQHGQLGAKTHMHAVTQEQNTLVQELHITHEKSFGSKASDSPEEDHKQ